ncbi:hypothetical protein MKEN_00319600 [Mycena kentingensis (nom. inval.)]|nr:hypothetical protein MKEN_00319600 [Mycena kentingensis (nom. inval.)]
MGRRVQTKPLHHAALAGDDTTVRKLLASGANVNELDAAGRSAVMCALAGDNWQNPDAAPSHTSPKHLQVLRTLIADAQISLHTLNAPLRAYRGVTPLGMAAWLDRADAVRVLLEESADCVAVDGADAHGATPLMYAARDGRLDVVLLLLRHGARPDFEDSNHRTALQFALPFPPVLGVCEAALRRYRSLEGDGQYSSELRQLVATTTTIPFTPLSTRAATVAAERSKTLVEAIRSADLPLIHSLLFPPADSNSAPAPLPLVNLPDALGWSPLHHAAAANSLDVLEALSAAGAVGGISTTYEQWTPLHCFAAASRLPETDLDVMRALVSRLVGPAASAALKTPFDAKDMEGGRRVDRNGDGRVRGARNARGLTPLEVCRPELRAAFGKELEEMRAGSSMSCRTIRGSSVSSVGSAYSGVGKRPPVIEEDHTIDKDGASVLENVDISASADQLLANLRLTSPEEPHAATPFHLNVLANLVREAEDLAAVVVAHYRAAAVEAGRDVRGLREAAGRAQMRAERVGRDVEARMRERGVVRIGRRFNRASQDSGVTAVSFDASRSMEALASADCNKPLPAIVVEDAERQLPAAVEPVKPPKRQSGTMKLRAWMMRKLQTADAVQQSKSPLEVIPEQQEAPEQLVATSPPSTPFAEVIEDELSTEAWVNEMLKSSHSMLDAASRDLERIRESIASAEHFISIVDRSAARVERVVGRALKKRETAISKLRATSKSSSADNDEFFVRPGLLSTKSSVASLASVYSARSSCLSLAATLSENEDDDTRVVRRLLLRKIETGASGARDEVEKGVLWLRTVKEVVRGAKKRAFV